MTWYEMDHMEISLELSGTSQEHLTRANRCSDLHSQHSPNTNSALLLNPIN